MTHLLKRELERIALYTRPTDTDENLVKQIAAWIQECVDDSAYSVEATAEEIVKLCEKDKLNRIALDRD